MRIASLTVSCLFCTCLLAPAAAEDLHRVVAGLNYRVVDGAGAQLVQAVRVRRDRGQVLVRYTNARTEWVDADRLVAQPQPIATDSGPYLFVAAALACLLDRNGCLRSPAARAAPSNVPGAAELRRVSDTSTPELAPR